MGLKTTYYLRTLAVSQVEKSTVKTEEFGSTHKREFLAMKMQVMPQPAPVSVSAVAEEETIKVPSLTPALATASQKGAPKLCAIEDPTCEACQ